ncbi:hypothetical protein LZ32DRAFT_238792 [Colletotrichum eremochloae]|nr:hypothetical protein LZ32DRAFT_238792 [Colletotrichum eremochloae]
MALGMCAAAVNRGGCHATGSKISSRVASYTYPGRVMTCCGVIKVASCLGSSCKYLRSVCLEASRLVSALENHLESLPFPKRSVSRMRRPPVIDSRCVQAR